MAEMKAIVEGDNHNLKYTQLYVVASLDFLGSTNFMKNDDNPPNDSLNIVYRLYERFIVFVQTSNFLRNERLEIKIFSDNIVIAMPISENDNSKSILRLLQFVSLFALLAISEPTGWLVRGGITIDKFFLDDVVVWGEALFRAYTLESKIAHYPRIILDDCVIESLESNNIGSEYVLLGEDGEYFLNYLEEICHHNGKGEFEKLLQNMKDGFQRIRQKVPTNEDGSIADDVYQKLYWHMTYINRELKKRNLSQYCLEI